MRRLAKHNSQLPVHILFLVGTADFDKLTSVNKLFARWVAASWKAATVALYPDIEHVAPILLARGEPVDWRSMYRKVSDDTERFAGRLGRLEGCQLSIFFARDENMALILRRSPLKNQRGDGMLWQMVVWDTQADTFIRGQWFVGTLHLENCHLSPDGQHFVYSASKGRKRDQRRVYDYPEHDALPHYTVISRPPFFTAVALFGTKTPRHGGGFFDSARCLSLRLYKMHYERRPTKGATPPESMELKCPFDHLAWDDELRQEGSEEHFLRLTPGYVAHKQASARLPPSEYTGELATLCEGEGGGLASESRQRQPLAADVDWVGRDHAGRMVFTVGGRLCYVHPRSGQALVLQDFSQERFTSIQAPEWARCWAKEETATEAEAAEGDTAAAVEVEARRAMAASAKGAANTPLTSGWGDWTDVL